MPGRETTMPVRVPVVTGDGDGRRSVEPCLDARVRKLVDSRVGDGVDGRPTRPNQPLLHSPQGAASDARQPLRTPQWSQVAVGSSADRLQLWTQAWNADRQGPVPCTRPWRPAFHAIAEAFVGLTQCPPTTTIGTSSPRAPAQPNLELRAPSTARHRQRRHRQGHPIRAARLGQSAVPRQPHGSTGHVSWYWHSRPPETRTPSSPRASARKATGHRHPTSAEQSSTSRARATPNPTPDARPSGASNHLAQHPPTTTARAAIHSTPPSCRRLASIRDRRRAESSQTRIRQRFERWFGVLTTICYRDLARTGLRPNLAISR